MNRLINITEIPKERNYTGYLWMSDTKEPLTDSLDKHLDITDSDNPFIVEGQLYAKEAQKSYSIKYVDGKHIVTEYDIPAKGIYDEKIFIPNRIKKSGIVFRQYWKSQNDDLCEGMEVLVPAAYIFMGFIHNEKEGK
jgi:CRISPR type III-associated protein (TIGR04423 family)